MKKVFLILLLTFFNILLFSQSKFSASVDVVSSYMYSGTNIGGNSPHIQPTIKYNYTTTDSIYKNYNLEIGLWGSSGISNKYREIDLYLTLNVKYISISFYKIYVPYLPDGSPSSSNISMLNNEFETTAYQDEVIVSYKGTEKLPLNILAEIYTYGNDRDYGYNLKLDKKHLNYFSTYIEGSYVINILNQNINLFTGITTHPGMFGNKFGIVNLGITDKYLFNITKEYNIPIWGTFIYNPMTKTPYFIIGTTINLM